MARRDFDIAVIGADAAGVSVAIAGAQLGLRVVVIAGGPIGPGPRSVAVKALLAASHAAMAGRKAARFGVRFDAARIDWAELQSHVRGVIAALAPNEAAARLRAFGATVLHGHARFVGRDALEVTNAEGASRLTANRFVVATGSRERLPDIPGLATTPYLTAETIAAVSEKPRHLVILGGGPLALELAQAHAGLGCQVTMVTTGRIAADEDRELADGLRLALHGDGVAMIEEAQIVRVEEGPVLHLADGRRIAGSHLLVASETRPAIDDLDLSSGAVRASARGIETDAGLRSLSNRRVYAVGDVADPKGAGPCAPPQLAGPHASIVIRRLVFRVPAWLNDRALPRAIGTVPALTQVGFTEAEAREVGHDIRILRWPLADNERAEIECQQMGLVKLVVNRHGRVLGAGILAPMADEMIGLWTLAIMRRTRLSALAAMIVPWPTMADAGKSAASSFFTPNLFAPRIARLARLLAWLP